MNSSEKDPVSVVLAENPWLDAEEEEQPVAGEALASDESLAVQAQVQAAEQTQEVPGPRFVYEIDPQDIYGSLRRLADQDPHFRNVLKSFTGRERQKELQSRVAELERELAKERYEKALAIVRSVPEDRLQEVYQQDEAFRQYYDYVANAEPPSDDDVGLDVEALINEAFEEASDWLPEARIKTYQQYLAPGGCKCNAIDEPHGVFDHDTEGRPLTMLRSFQYFRDVLGREVETAKQAYERARQARMQQMQPMVQQTVHAPQMQQPEQVATQVFAQQAMRTPDVKPTKAGVAQAVEMLRNPRLAANPDISIGQPVAGGDVLTKDQIDAMHPEEILRRWPNEGDFERDVLAGKILIPGVNA